MRHTYPKLVSLLVIGAALIVALSGWVYRSWRTQNKEIEANRRAIQALKAEIQLAKKANDGVKEDPADELAMNMNQVTSASDKAIQGDAIIIQIEDTLDVWISRIAKLQTYLEKHPEKRIPEMAHLGVNAWLDVTKEASLDSDADFRKALSKLRSLAKRRTSPVISRAVREAILAKSGRVPTDVQELAAYLPVDFDPAILQRFSINLTGEVIPVSNDREKIMLVEKPVDELWDTLLIFGERGSVGERLRHQSTIESALAKAFREFHQASATPPTSVSDLAPFLGGEFKSGATVDAVFNALTTTPSF